MVVKVIFEGGFRTYLLNVVFEMVFDCCLKVVFECDSAAVLKVAFEGCVSRLFLQMVLEGGSSPWFCAVVIECIFR